MEIQFFNILKSGNYEKLRATRSSFNDRRRIVVYNPFAKELWMLNGYQLHSEILRLTDYAMDILRKDLKVRHRVKVVDPDESQEKFEFLLNLSKNPELAESLVESSKSSKKSKKTAKKATKKPETKTTKKPKKKEKKIKAIEVKTKRKPLPTVEMSTIPKVSLPTPSKKTTLGIAKGDLHDDDDGSVRMVEEFQIAYYEASGGDKLIVEELDESISKGIGYDKLVGHIRLINELVKSKASATNAKDVLEKSIDELIITLFSKPAKKTTKKVTKKSVKKVTKKPARKATKKTTKKTKKTKKK